MAQEKSYTIKNSENGSVYVDDNVIKIITNLVSKKVEGIYSLTGKFVDVFNSSKKGVHITSKEDRLHLEISIAVIFGHKVVDVAEKTRISVIEALKENFNIENPYVDVLVKEILVEEEQTDYIEE